MLIAARVTARRPWVPTPMGRPVSRPGSTGQGQGGQLRQSALEDGSINGCLSLFLIDGQHDREFGDQRLTGIAQQVALPEGDALLVVAPRQIAHQSSDDVDAAAAEPVGVRLDPARPVGCFLFARPGENVKDLSHLLRVQYRAQTCLLGTVHRHTEGEIGAAHLQFQVFGALTLQRAGGDLGDGDRSVVRVYDDLSLSEVQCVTLRRHERHTRPLGSGPRPAGGRLTARRDTRVMTRWNSHPRRRDAATTASQPSHYVTKLGYFVVGSITK